MLTHNDTFEIEGEHFSIISVYEENKFHNYNVKTYELRSRHNPLLSNNKILTEEKIQEYERVENPNEMEYLIHHCQRLEEISKDLREHKNNGNLGKLIINIRELESRINEIQICISNLERFVDAGF